MTSKKSHKGNTSVKAPTDSSTLPANKQNPNGSTKSTEVAPNEQKKRNNVVERTVWTFVMLAGFFALLAAGHIFAVLMVLFVQIMVFKEILAIATVPAKQKRLPRFQLMNWYFLATTLYFTYGETAIYYFKHIVVVDEYLAPFASHHRFLSFIMYCAGFAFFVLNLRAGHYQFQFAQFCWTHMTLIFVIGSSHLIVNNIFEGLFWFVVPAGYVICNDTFAYVCGKMFGRTQLIAISPKKTVEGFLGAWFFTVVVGGLVSQIMMQSKYMICPAYNIEANFFTGLDCQPNPVFYPKTYTLPPILAGRYGFPDTVDIAPVHFHLAVISTFASLFAPFGGFFASGLKRAFKIKDFGDSIPGHGGLTDRMDCQFLNGCFVYLYYHSFIAEHNITVGKVLELVILSLSTSEQIELVQSLHQYLISQGVLSKATVQCLQSANFKLEDNPAGI